MQLCLAVFFVWGPVFVEFPIDTLYPYPIVRRELGLIPNPSSLRQRLVNLFLEYYFARLYGDAWGLQDYSPIPVHIPYPQLEQGNWIKCKNY